MRSLKTLRTRFSAVLGTVLMAGALQAGSIGAAAGFGAFIFGNSTDTGDIASRIAIGGNGPTNTTSVGGGIQAGPTILTANPNVVAVVEGNGANNGININSGQAAFNAGGIVQNGTALASDPFLNPANGGQSIASYKSFYETMSSQLSALTSTAGTTMTNNQGLQLNSTGVAGTTVVYNLSSSQWATLGGFSYNAGQTIIVNVAVSGSVTGGTSYNLTANGSQPGNTGSGFSNIIFNFVGANGTVDLGNEGYGTILAPDATITSGSVVNGQIIANQLNTIGELHDGSAFTGTVPNGPGTTQANTPEPGSMLLMGGGLIGLVMFSRRFTKKV